MDKRTIVINSFLICLICLVGVGFASYVFFQSYPSKQEETFSPKEDIPFLNFQPIIDKKVTAYDVELSLLDQKDSDFDYTFLASIQVLDKSVDYVQFESKEVFTKDMFDVYGFFQNYVQEDVEISDDYIVFELTKMDQKKLLDYLKGFVSFSSTNQPITCQALHDSEHGYLLEIICTQENYYYVFRFTFEE